MALTAPLPSEGEKPKIRIGRSLTCSEIGAALGPCSAP